MVPRSFFGTQRVLGRFDSLLSDKFNKITKKQDI